MHTKALAWWTLAVVAALGVPAIAYASYFNGTSGSDDVVIERGSSVAYLRGGDDSFTGAKGNAGGSDRVYGGSGNDRIVGRSHVDTLRGGPGDDRLVGGPARDGVYGAGGDDTLIGGAGIDHFLPGPGRDTCFGQRKDKGFPGNCEIVRFVD
ncbi:MAG: hypothetical protein M3383_04000 [Actinomycetota bacterium]|nr:hypothetical protein [Actinomycetota bacterium]